MPDTTSNLSRFLYSVRIRLGFENISNFLSTYALPMSDNYYRDVEGGRKHLSFEKAIELSEIPPFNETEDTKLEFLWHMLRDILPEKLHSKLLFPRPDTTFENVREAQKKLEYDRKIHRGAATGARSAQQYIPNNLEPIVQNNDLLPLLHFIYMVETAKQDEIERVCHRMGIKVDFKRICRVLEKLGVRIDNTKHKRVFTRALPIFRVPRDTNDGKKFLQSVTIDEIERSFTKEELPEEKMFSEVGTFHYVNITAVAPEKKEKLTERLRDFISEVAVMDKQLEADEAEPFFISIVVSGRSEYDGRIKSSPLRAR
jgi:hypothetical protein